MSSTDSRTPAQAAPPVFSYAQAAKGRATATVASPSQISQATSGISTPAKESHSPIIAASASNGGAVAASEAVEKLANGTHDAIPKSDALGLGLESESKSSTLINPASVPGSPSFGTASTSTLPKEDDLTLGAPAQSESVWDRNTNGADKDAEGRRSKKGKKQKTSEKEAEKEEEKKPEILVAAPPPTVNIWQQRREAQALKAKPSPSIPQGSPPVVEASITTDATKLTDSKKRGTDDAEKSLGAVPNGTTKEPSNTTKGKKGSDGASRGKEDVSNKRAGPRGSRVSEKEEKAVVNQLPPPVEDATSWPAPEMALAEEKRRAQEEKERSEKEKEERDEPASNKPRPKEKWVTVPYVPSVNFSTPLPPRGGRGRGGGRVGRDNTGRGAAAGDKGNNASNASPGGDAENRGRGTATSSRAASLPPNSKRLSTDMRAQGKVPAISSADKSKAGPANDGRRTSTQIDQFDDHQEQLSRGDNSRGFNADQGAFDEQKGELNRGPDHGANIKENSLARDRADGRVDRGRGGYRGRGGHNGFPNGQQPHAFANGHGPQQQNGFVRPNPNPFSPSMPPSNFSNQFAQPPARGGGRGGPRSQSIPNAGFLSRFPPNAGPQPLGMLQTPGMYEYQPMQPMSAVPYHTYVDQFSVLAMVSMQLEYYFSIDNLCKDVFLRKHMDSQGFVFLTFIADFKRIQALTKELEMLRFACQESEVIDIIKGEDGLDRIRRKEGWEKWVLGMDERDESVRNDGPTFHQRHQPLPRPQPMAPMVMQSPHPMSPAFSPTATDPNFRPFANGPPLAMNGNGSHFHPDTPLSAAVPDFAPGVLSVNGTPDPLEAETTFYDEDVANLKLVFATPKGGETSKSQPYHSPSSRTFSNGSIDGRSVTEEAQDDRQGRGLTNGSHLPATSPDSLRRSRSPFAQFSPTKSTASNGPPVMWVKGQRQQAPIPKDNNDELYTTVRARALMSRESSAPSETHPDMKVLYEFWSHFLCRNFNPKMYTEFRQFAIEDAKQNAFEGTKSLISFYDEILISKKKVIPDVLALHYVELVKDERANAQPNSDRPAFAKLRLAWRNGALDLKSRKKIDGLVDQKLREELER